MKNYFKNLFFGEEDPSPEDELRPMPRRKMIKEAISGFLFMLLLSAVTFLAILIMG